MQKGQGLLMDERNEKDAMELPDDDEEAHRGEKCYHLVYEREDGETVDEAIWAKDHREALRKARKRGLVRVLSLEREASHADSGKRDVVTSYFLLPLLVALLVTALVVLLSLWRAGKL